VTLPKTGLSALWTFSPLLVNLEQNEISVFDGNCVLPLMSTIKNSSMFLEL
jgi:hypothetical protein